MKKEQLVELGLNDEQIAGVFKLNGLDINDLKDENQVLETKNKQLESQLSDANSKIDEFSNLNIDEIRKESKEYKDKYEQVKADSEKELSKIKTNFAIEKAVIKAGARNAKAVTSLLDYESLQDSNNLENDISEQINKLKETDNYLFADKETIKVVSKSNAPTESVDEKKVNLSDYAQQNRLI